LVIDDSIALSQRRHLLNQLRARSIRAECLLGIADCSHQLRVSDQAAFTSRRCTTPLRATGALSIGPKNPSLH
jgi:hypothetical protein